MLNMSRFFLFSVCAFLLLFPVAHAQAGIVEFLFPSLKDEQPNPSETLKAPFADTEEEVKNATVPPKEVPLNQPHRTSGEIGEWVTSIASDALTFEGKQDNELEGKKVNFDTGGWSEYEAFLEAQKIKSVIDSGQYQLRSYVQDIPVLLNEGAVNERYRWLYEVPVHVSYLQRNLDSYKNARVEPINRIMTVRVQVGRIADADNDMGLQVERWSGKVNKSK